MARYIAMRDTWLSDECRMVREGQEFDKDFPAGTKVGGNLQLVAEDKPAAKGKKAAAADDLV